MSVMTKEKVSIPAGELRAKIIELMLARDTWAVLTWEIYEEDPLCDLVPTLLSAIKRDLDDVIIATSSNNHTDDIFKFISLVQKNATAKIGIKSSQNEKISVFYWDHVVFVVARISTGFGNKYLIMVTSGNFDV